MEKRGVNNSERHKRLLADILKARCRDSIACISQSINSFFFISSYGCSAPDIGGVFLTSAAGATRGNLTEILLFCSNSEHVEYSADESHVACARDKNRWIRGVLIASASLSPPSQSTFLDRQCNGKLLFGGLPSLQLFIRVVGVSLPDYTPICQGNTAAAAVQEHHRRLLQYHECVFLGSLVECLRTMLRAQSLTVEERHDQGQGATDECGEGGEFNGTCPGGTLFAGGEPMTLLVPVYYLAVHIEDNASSQITSVAHVATHFMDLLIDPKTSAVLESTRFVQSMVLISDAMGEKAGANGKSDVALRNLNDALIALHGQAEAALCMSRQRLCSASGAVCERSKLPNKEFPELLSSTPQQLPGVLVHCLRGVSRSPSIIVAYYLQKCSRDFWMLSRIPRLDTGSPRATTQLTDRGSVDAAEMEEEKAVFSFPRMLQCLREARPVVNPQVCFLAELRAMWFDIAAKEAQRYEKSAEP
ncbi:hypothetical protein, conserved [Trypanosoma vivax Y486]|uniref:Tyrosine specific protein phosphatases domain-containing protein n=1 Tax=Trypanosoma vivax (strain Y486) TaxID=1055687 RepID=F9WPK8_TRYVY|nr:hypothetical protein, conserved [Trypanosoma vivax Y486]|eukprot:CCD19485.1 hypothetical protein, conserved [Trypanosoma vivax Y486]